MREENKKLVKAAIESGARECRITECGKEVAVIVDGKIKLPCVNEDVRKACKPLYMAACNIRDGKSKTWEGIAIPPSYWPAEGIKRGGGVSNPSPDKPLFKAGIGNNIREFDKSFETEEALLSALWEWMKPIAQKKWREYHTMEVNKPFIEEFNGLLKEVKPFTAMDVDIVVKAAMITPLLTSKGYKDPAALANNLLEIASGETKEMNLDLLQKN